MDKKGKQRVGRRQFLKDGSAATAAVGIGCFAFGGLKEALALSRQTGKPVLTEASLNSIIPKDPSGLRSFAQNAKRDLKGLLRNRFALTAAQEQEINGISATDLQRLHKALDVAAEHGIPLRVRILGAQQSSLTGSGLMKASFTGAPAAFALFFQVCVSRDSSGRFTGVSVQAGKGTPPPACPSNTTTI